MLLVCVEYLDKSLPQREVHRSFPLRLRVRLGSKDGTHQLPATLAPAAFTPVLTGGMGQGSGKGGKGEQHTQKTSHDSSIAQVSRQGKKTKRRIKWIICMILIDNESEMRYPARPR